MTTQANSRRLLSVAEAAERIGVSPVTIRRRIRSGELEAIRVGRAPSRLLRVDERALEALLRPVEGEAA